jgi:hypothetical protein
VRDDVAQLEVFDPEAKCEAHEDEAKLEDTTAVTEPPGA